MYICKVVGLMRKAIGQKRHTTNGLLTHLGQLEQRSVICRGGNVKAFFKKIFNKSAKQDSMPALNSTRGFHASTQGGSESTVRAQLVHVVMRDLLRKSGIPPDWIVCHPQVLNSKSRGQGIFVRLSVKHWDPRLIRYLFAFQKALLTDIVRFEPQAAKWLHGIAWQLEVASSCPDTVLPGKDFWLDVADAVPTWPTVAPSQTGATPINASAAINPMAQPRPQHAPENATRDREAVEELERFFAIRDKELAAQADSHILPSGYEHTEPAPLTRF